MISTRTKQSRRLLIALIATVVVLLTGALVRYFGPPITVRSYFDDISHSNYDSAVGRVCPANQQDARAGLAIFQHAPLHLDTSQLAYDLQDENLNTAHVSVHGKILLSGTAFGNTIATPLDFKQTITVQSNGLWWCVTTSASLQPS